LYQRLQRDGFQPWLDEKDILPGQDWESEIQNALRTADVVIVCLSSHAVNKYGYVQKEIRLALDAADQKPERTIFIIPLKLDECPVPESLRCWHWLNYTSAGGHDRLLHALRLKAATVDGLRAAAESYAAHAAPAQRKAKTKITNWSSESSTELTGDTEAQAASAAPPQGEVPAFALIPNFPRSSELHPPAFSQSEEETRMNAPAKLRFVTLFNILKDCYVFVGACHPTPAMESARKDLVGWPLGDDEFTQLSSLVRSGDEKACGAADEILSLGNISITSYTVAVTCDMLSSSVGPIQQVAIRALSKMERLDPGVIADKVLSRLASLLRDIGGAWLTTAYFVECLGPRACTSEMLEALEVCLYTSNVSDRAPEIVLALGAAAATPNILSRLIHLLKEGSADESHSAANALFVFRDSPSSPQIFVEVLPLLKHKRWYRRAAAAIAIGSLRPRISKDAAANLSDLLIDNEYDVRAAAAEGIGKLGGVCAELQPKIIARILEFAMNPDDEGYLKRAAIQALGQLGPSAAIPEVLTGLKSLRHHRDQQIADDADDSFLTLSRQSNSGAHPAISDTE
jgi:HEAT repeat protein